MEKYRSVLGMRIDGIVAAVFLFSVSVVLGGVVLGSADAAQINGRAPQGQVLGVSTVQLAAIANPVQQYTLTITKAGTGTGTVTTNPAGVSCGAACQAPYNSGTAVTLTAVPAAGSVLSGWTGCNPIVNVAAAGFLAVENSCTVTMSANKAVTVTFTGIAAVPSVTTSVASSVTMNSAALNGSANPNGYAATAYFRYSTTNPAACNDSFGTRVPASSGTSVGSGSVAVPFSQNVTGLAPATTYYYCAIGTSSSGVGLGNLGAFTTQSSLATYTLSVAKSGDGTGSGTVYDGKGPEGWVGINCGTTCQASYAPGTVVQLSAEPAAGSTFAGWQGCPSNPTSGTCSITMTTNLTVAATFTASSQRPIAAQLDVISPLSAQYQQGQVAKPFSVLKFSNVTSTDVGITNIGIIADNASALNNLGRIIITDDNPNSAARLNFEGYLVGGPVSNPQVNVNPSSPWVIPANSSRRLYINADIKTSAPGGTMKLGVFAYMVGTVGYNVDSMIYGWPMTVPGAAESYQLTVSGLGGTGSVVSMPAGIDISWNNGMPTGTQTGAFVAGSIVNLYASAGFGFATWGGACSGQAPGVCTLTMTSANMGATVTFTGGTVLQPGHLYKMENNATIYYLASDGKRYVFPALDSWPDGAKMLTSWGYTSADVEIATSAQIAAYPLGANVTVRPGTYLVQRSVESGYTDVYAVSYPNVLHLVSADQLPVLYGANWTSRTMKVPDIFFTNYTSGSPLTNKYPDSALISYYPSPTVGSYNYLVYGGKKLKIMSDAAFVVNRFQNDNVMRLPLESNITYPDGENITGLIACLADPSQTTPCNTFVGGAGPVITNLTAVPSYLGAVVTWTTNVPTNNIVFYVKDGSTSWSWQGTETPLTTSHRVSITDIDGNSLYQYKVIATDADGNRTTSAVQTFHTLAAPTTFNLITPNGGEQWQVGKTYTVGWSTAGIPAAYYVYSPGFALLDEQGQTRFSVPGEPLGVRVADPVDTRYGRMAVTIPSSSNLVPGNSYRPVVAIGGTFDLPSMTATSSSPLKIVTSVTPINTCTTTATTVRRSALRNTEFGNLGLDITSHPEILKYRIQWFSGAWSDWFTPGVDDVDWKANVDGGKRRVWGYFGDHSHEFEKCTTTSTLPDFIATDVKIEKRSGDTAPYIYVTAKNIGGAVTQAQILSVSIQDLDTNQVYYSGITGPFATNWTNEMSSGNPVILNSSGTYRLRVKVDNTGENVGIITEANENNNILEKTVTYIGGTPTQVIKITDDSAIDEQPVLVRRSNGDLVVVYTSAAIGSSGVAYSKVSHDNGVTWQGPYRILDSWSRIDLIEDASHNLVLFTGDITPTNSGPLVTMTSADGIVWGAKRVVVGTTNFNGVESLMQASDGLYYVAYVGSVVPAHTFMTRSADLVTWETPWEMTVYDKPVQGTRLVQFEQKYPSIYRYHAVVVKQDPLSLVMVRSSDAKQWVMEHTVEYNNVHGTMGQNFIKLNGRPVLFYATASNPAESKLTYTYHDGFMWRPKSVADQGPFPFGADAAELPGGKVGVAYMHDLVASGSPTFQRDIYFKILNTVAVPFDGGVPISNSVGDSVSTNEAALQQRISELEYQVSELERSVVEKEKALTQAVDAKLVQRLAGKILLQVDGSGEAWYVDKDTSKRFYLKDGATAYTALQAFGLGITDANLAKLPVGVDERVKGADGDGDGLDDALENSLGTNALAKDSDSDGYDDATEVRTSNNPTGVGPTLTDTKLTQRLEGKIVLQVEGAGQAWYVIGGKRYYMANGDAAYKLMRYKSLGIKNDDLRKIGVGEFEVAE